MLFKYLRIPAPGYTIQTNGHLWRLKRTDGNPSDPDDHMSFRWRCCLDSWMLYNAQQRNNEEEYIRILQGHIYRYESETFLVISPRIT